jgi:adenylate cyclase
MTGTGPSQPRNSRATAPSAGGILPWATLLLMALLACFVVFCAEKLDLLEGPELQGYDYLVSAQKPEEPPAAIVYVDFDEDSVKRYNAFPVPRVLLGDLLRKISSGKPAVIGLDVILDKERAAADDRRLVSIISDAGNVILVSEYGFGRFPPHEPLPSFADAAAGVAFADVPIDADGTVRRMLLKVVTPEYKRLSFPVALADYFSDQHLRPGRPGYLLFGTREIPLATTGPDSAWIHFHPSPPVRGVSVQTVLDPSFDTSVFQGKIVMVGQTSEMGKDLFVSPVTHAGIAITEKGSSHSRSLLSGTEIHAGAVATLLGGDVLRTMNGAARWWLAFLCGLAVAAVAFRSRWYVAIATYLIVAALLFGLAVSLFTHRHIWLPFFSVEACLLLALPAGLGYRSVEERRQKKLMEAERGQIMGLFERYVSPDVAAEIWKRRDEIVLAGEERVATILFSDIRSFTAMTAGVPSQEVLAWLNRYLTAMGEVIKSNRGFLNKFIGDGIMVVFGAPLTDGPREDACRAVRCAKEMLARVDEWNAQLPAGQPKLKIGIGIHSGPVTAGNVGSKDRLEYSVIGETVNLASRLESLTKDLKTPIVISPETWEYIRGSCLTVSLGEAQVRGFTSAIPLYGVQEDPTPGEVRP